MRWVATIGAMTIRRSKEDGEWQAVKRVGRQNGSVGAKALCRIGLWETAVLFDLKLIWSRLISDFGSKLKISGIYKDETFGSPLDVAMALEVRYRIRVKLSMPPVGRFLSAKIPDSFSGKSVPYISVKHLRPPTFLSLMAEICVSKTV